jgi:hypothetical protein
MRFREDNPEFAETDHELTNKKADWIVWEEERAYDYTIRDPSEVSQAFIYKQLKYENIYFGKPVAPIVVSYGITIHKESLKYLLELIKLN